MEETKTGLVSVIVPVYNVERYLDKCVQSILHQSYQNLDIVLVDDGSCDGSGEQCDHYAKIDQRVRVLHQTNQGLSSARNAGTRVARGEYIVFVDADDSLMDNYIAELYSAIIRTHTCMSMCRYYEITEDDYEMNEVTAPFLEREEIIQGDRFMREVLRGSFHAVTAWNKMYSIELAQKVPFPEGKYYEDLSTFLSFAKEAETIAWVDKALYVYVKRREGSITNKISDKHLADFYDACEIVDKGLQAAYPTLLKMGRKILSYLLLTVWVEYLLGGNSRRNSISPKVESSVKRMPIQNGFSFFSLTHLGGWLLVCIAPGCVKWCMMIYMRIRDRRRIKRKGDV